MAFAAGTSVRWVFTVSDGPDAGLTFDACGDCIVLVGNGPRAHFALSARDPYVSGLHCLIELHGGTCLLRDLKSTNGTRVNGDRVQTAELKPGDSIRVGKTRIRVTTRMDAGSADAVAMTCVLCGARLDAAETPPSEEAFRCRTCAERERGVRERSRPRRLPVACRDCQLDLTECANADGRAIELRDVASYLCEGCASARAASKGTVGRVVGDYHAMGSIGAGGYGEVWAAWHRRTGRLVALKTIRQSALSSEPRLASWFRREIAVARELVHPNVARWLGSGTFEGRHFLVVEYVEGGNLEHALRREYHGPVPAARAVRYAVEALDAVDFAHRQGFVHRDIKPSNLIRTGPSKGDRIKVTDFGLAKSFVSAGTSLLTEAGEIRGSPYFMAKEQFLDYKFVGPAVDVYGMGVTLYYLLTGKMPYSYPSPLERAEAGDAVEFDAGELVRVIIEDERVPIRVRAPEIPDALAVVVDVAVKREPADRFETAAGFRAELVRASRALGGAASNTSENRGDV